AALRRRRGERLRLGLDLRRLGALVRPGLVELDAPLALGGLHQRQAGAERASAPAAKPGHRAFGATLGDQLAGDGERKLLAGLALPDHEATAGILAGPARVALAVLDDV